MELVEKPWGKEYIFANTPLYVGKIIEINKGHRLSLQYHNKKDESIFVENGELTLVTATSSDLSDLKEQTIKMGESARIIPGLVHRFEARKGWVVLIEVSTPFLDDVVRLDDDYGRV